MFSVHWKGSLLASPPPSWLPLVDKVVRHADLLFDTHLTHGELEEVVEVSFETVDEMFCSVEAEAYGREGFSTWHPGSRGGVPAS